MNTVGYDHEKTKQKKKNIVKELQLYKPRGQGALQDKNVKMIPALYIQIKVEFIINNLKKLSNFMPLAECRLNKRNAANKHSKLPVKISELTNKTRRITCHLKIAKERISEILGDDTLGLSILQCMTPNS